MLVYAPFGPQPRIRWPALKAGNFYLCQEFKSFSGSSEHLVILQSTSARGIALARALIVGLEDF